MSITIPGLPNTFAVVAWSSAISPMPASAISPSTRRIEKSASAPTSRWLRVGTKIEVSVENRRNVATKSSTLGQRVSTRRTIERVIVSFMAHSDRA